MGQFGFTDPLPQVLYLQVGGSLFIYSVRELDLLSFRSIFGRVVHQNPYRLLHKARIDQHFHPGTAVQQAVAVLLIDHQGFLVDFRHQFTGPDLLPVQRSPAAVPPGQKEQLLHQIIHMVRLIPDGGNALFQDLLIRLAPAVQHVGVSLDDRDGRTQLMGSVIDEAGLLPQGIPHTQEQVVHGRFHPGQVSVPEGKRSFRFRLIRPDVLQGFLDLLVFVLVEGQPAQLVRLQGDLIDRRQDLPDPAVLPVIRNNQAQGLQDQQGHDQYADHGKGNQTGDSQNRPSRL